MRGLQRGHGTELPDHPALNLATHGSRWRSRHRLLARSRRSLAALGASLALLALAATAATAHDGATTSMEIPAERVPPGSSMPLVGLDFFPGERLRIVLNGPDGTSLALGSVQAGADGHFETFLDLPDVVPSGVVGIDAISESGITVRTFVTIDPDAPPASYDPVFPTPAEQSPAPEVDLVPLATGGLAVLGLAALLLRTRRSGAVR